MATKSVSQMKKEREARLSKRAANEKATEASIQKLSQKAFKKARSEGKSRSEAEFAAKIKESRVKTSLREQTTRDVNVGTSGGGEYSAKISPTGEASSIAFNTEATRQRQVIQQARANEQFQSQEQFQTVPQDSDYMTAVPQSQARKLSEASLKDNFRDYQYGTLTTPNVAGLTPERARQIGVKGLSRDEAFMVAGQVERAQSESRLRGLESRRIEAGQRALDAEKLGSVYGKYRAESFKYEAQAISAQMRGAEPPKEFFLSRKGQTPKGVDLIKASPTVFTTALSFSQGRVPTATETKAYGEARKAFDVETSSLLYKSSAAEARSKFLGKPYDVAKTAAKSGVYSFGAGTVLGTLAGTAALVPATAVAAAGGTLLAAYVVGKTEKNAQTISDPFERGRYRARAGVDFAASAAGGAVGGYLGVKTGQKLAVKTDAPTFKRGPVREVKVGKETVELRNIEVTTTSRNVIWRKDLPTVKQLATLQNTGFRTAKVVASETLVGGKVVNVNSLRGSVVQSYPAPKTGPLRGVETIRFTSPQGKTSTARVAKVGKDLTVRVNPLDERPIIDAYSAQVYERTIVKGGVEVSKPVGAPRTSIKPVKAGFKPEKWLGIYGKKGSVAGGAGVKGSSFGEYTTKFSISPQGGKVSLGYGVPSLAPVVPVVAVPIITGSSEPLPKIVSGFEASSKFYSPVSEVSLTTAGARSLTTPADLTETAVFDEVGVDTLGVTDSGVLTDTDIFVGGDDISIPDIEIPPPPIGGGAGFAGFPSFVSGFQESKAKKKRKKGKQLKLYSPSLVGLNKKSTKASRAVGKLTGISVRGGRI